jgi:hypothetical protein
MMDPYLQERLAKVNSDCRESLRTLLASAQDEVKPLEVELACVSLREMARLNPTLGNAFAFAEAVLAAAYSGALEVRR